MVASRFLDGLLGYRLRRAQVAAFRHFDDVVAAEDPITPGRLGTLLIVEENPGLSQSRLAEALGVDRSTLVGVVGELEARGLVTRTRSEADRRRYELVLTAEGERALARWKQRVRRHEDNFAKALSSEERKTLMELLSRLPGVG